MYRDKLSEACFLGIVGCYCLLMGMFFGLAHPNELHPDTQAVYLIGISGGTIIALLGYIQFSK